MEAHDADEPAASKRLVNAFFDGGRVDTSLYTPASVDFTPRFSHGSIARIVLGVMLGFAALTVLSLLWMPFRVGRRGAFGRKARVLLRSVYPIVLGLGGWFLCALVVMTAWPTVPLDDELLALLCVGAPIGLCAYWAWVQTDRSRNTKPAGLTATIAGALLGGWFGFHATTGLFALLTSILGAVAGANLAVLVFDISWERALRGRPATAPVASQGALTGAGS